MHAGGRALQDDELAVDLLGLGVRVSGAPSESSVVRLAGTGRIDRTRGHTAVRRASISPPPNASGIRPYDVRFPPLPFELQFRRPSQERYQASPIVWDDLR